MNLVCESLEELYEDRTLLRTLTLKSHLGFGSNGEVPIESLLKSMPGYNYRHGVKEKPLKKSVLQSKNRNYID